MLRSPRRPYIPRADRPVAAVRLAFEADGFAFCYRKWGGEQRAKPGDWLVDHDGDVYTVDAAVFARTYRAIHERGPGAYVKTTPIWAERAEASGVVQTKEGSTRYQRGDYLVANSDDGSDQYAVSAERFEALYMPANEDDR
jgi:hypothetical protein